MKSLAWCSRLGDFANDGDIEEFTTEAPRAQSKDFFIKKFSELCELCASAVKFPEPCFTLLKNRDSRLFKKAQMRGAREIDERRRIY